MRLPLRRWTALALRLSFSLASLLPAGPVLAHGGVIRWDDPAHLAEDLLVEFGLPLAILLGGALIGLLLARWLARHGPVPEAEPPATVEAATEVEAPSPAGAPEQRGPVGRVGSPPA
jgi:hypothetical protein